MNHRHSFSSKIANFVVVVSWLATLVAANAKVTVESLRCEYRVNPEGLDVAKPRLGWVVESNHRSANQTAYQILVASRPNLLAEGKADLWDSRKVISASPLNVEYAGSSLNSHQQCFWEVRVWDETGSASGWSAPAKWSMGLLNATDWQAHWISDTVLADATNRPLSPIHCYRSALTNTPDAPKWILLDLGATNRVDSIDLLAARPAKLSFDFHTVMFPLRFKIQTATTEDFRDAQTVVDQTSVDYPSPRFQKCHFTFPAVAARFVRLDVSRLARWDAQDFGLALGGFMVFDGTNSLALHAKVECSDSLENDSWSKQFLVDGKGDVSFAPDSPAVVVNFPNVPRSHTVSRVPLLRREFDLPGKISRAVLSVTARGFYECRINGHRVGDELLAPGYTSHSQRLQYQTHDVTSLLRSGRNAIGALLGYGWYAGHMNLYENRCFDGTFPQFLAQLDVELEDGRKISIVSDEHWRSTLSGPVRCSDLLDGEATDCRMELAGWDESNFDDHDWKKVWSQSRDDTPLVWQRCQPVREIQQLRATAIREVKPGIYVFDFGQEITGWCRLKTAGPAGTQITLRHAEVIDADGNVNLKNLWGTAQQEDYILDGKGERTLEPHFTYHGFRYVEISGLTKKPTADTLTAINIRSALPDAGEFECSNELYTRILSAARWTQMNLMFDVPAGCAARSERVAWLGDVRPCVQSTCFNFDAAAFFSKFSQDIRDSQTAEGRYCDITPHAHLRGTDICVGSAGWADCGVSLPWEEYVNYADSRALAEHFESARRWVDYVAGGNPDFIWRNGRGQNDWGDWMSARGHGSPKEIGATAFFAQSADFTARMAKALGRDEEAKKYETLFANIKKAFMQNYVSTNGVVSLTPGSEDGQIAEGNYALAIGFGLLDEPLKSLAVSNLCAAIDKANGHPTIGFWTPTTLLLVLSDSGRHDIAAKMFNLDTVPSWGYMAKRSGTFWESFDADVKNRSLNHWTHSSVGEWLWREIAGLNPDESKPGYEAFTIHPRPCDEVSWCKARYNSVRGPIGVEWRQAKNKFTLNLTVPVTSSATIYLPANGPSNVRESGKAVEKSKGVHWLRQENGESVFQVESGTYHFVVQ